MLHAPQPRPMRRGWPTDRILYHSVIVFGLVLMGGLWYLHFTNRPLLERVVAPPSAPSAPLTGIRGVASVPPLPLHGGDHAVVDPQRCLARSARGAQTGDTVHRWVDAAGVTHYSDRPPTGVGTTSHTQRRVANDQPVTVSIETVDANIPPYTRSRAIADAVGIGKVFDDVLGLRTDGGLALRVVLAGSDAAFARLVPRGSVSSSGVYIGRQRRIVVRTQSDDEATLAILRHEITHALVHEWIGHLPTALNEGLAGYFEHFEGRGMGGTIDPTRYQRQMAKARPGHDARPALVRLLNLPNADFHTYDRSGNYARSLALVSTIMGVPEHRPAMSALLKAQRANACDPVDAATLLARQWRGGLDSLAAAWFAHQSGAVPGTHAY